MVKSKTKEINMTKGNLLLGVIRFAVPLIATGVLQLLYSAMDMIVVGKFAGAAALSAVGSTNALVSMIINIFIGLSIGVGVCISRYYGARNQESIDKTVHTAIAIAIIGGVFLSILAFFIVEPMLVWMMTPTDVMAGATIYLKVFFLGMPMNLLYNFGASMLRATGDTKSPLVYLAKAGLVNITLNLLFVIVFHMSVVGVAVATIISQAISAGMVMRCLSVGTGVLKFELSKLKIHKQQLINILKIGLPAGIQGSLFSISNVLVQSSINSFDSTIITAGNAASNSLECLMFVAINSVTQAAITASGQNMGAGEYGRVRKSAYISSGIAVALSIVLASVFTIFAKPLIGLYSDGDLSVVAVGVERLKYMTTFYIACGLMDVLVGQLKGMGYNLLPTCASFCCVCLFRVVWISLVFNKVHTLQAIYWVYPISWTLATIAELVLLVIALKRLPKDKEKKSEAVGAE